MRKSPKLTGVIAVANRRCNIDAQSGRPLLPWACPAKLSSALTGAQCRRLAAAVNDDRTVEVLLALAEKFERRAAECTARESSEKAD